MPLITPADIAAYTGDTYSSAEEIVLQTIIDAVIAQAASELDTDLESRVTFEVVDTTDGFITPRNRVARAIGLFTGPAEVLVLDPPSSMCSVTLGTDSVGDLTILLGTPSVTDEIIVGTSTMATLLAAINSTSSWTAVAGDDYNGDTLMGAIVPGVYTPDETTGLISLYACTKFRSVRPLTRKTFAVADWCSLSIFGYHSGFQTLPADLLDALVRYAIAAYDSRTGGASGLIAKSESVGDWAAAYFTAAEQQAGSAVFINYKTVLSKYKNYGV